MWPVTVLLCSVQTAAAGCHSYGRERELGSRTLNCAALQGRAAQGVIPKVRILGSGLALTGSGLAGLAHRHGAGVAGLHPGLHLLHAGLAWGWPSQGAASWGRATGGHCGTVVATEYLYRTESRERELSTTRSTLCLLSAGTFSIMFFLCWQLLIL